MRTKKIMLVSAGILLLAVGVGLVLLHIYWPFSEPTVRSELSDAASAQVTFSKFHIQYFPPGCVAEGVTFTESGAAGPLITIRRLSISSNVFGLLHHHVSLIRAEGARIFWQHSSRTSTTPQIVIDRLVADDAVVEVPRDSENGPLRFVFHQFSIDNLHGSTPASFSAVLENPLPKGLLRISGKYGPWNKPEPMKTPVDGTYTLENADLGVFPAIAGFLSSTGRFKGPFEAIAVDGRTQTPDLQVTQTHHGLPLQTDFSATVKGSSGEVFLRSVKAQFGRDNLDIHGSIAKDANGARVANLDLECEKGRIEDTFYPFIRAPKSALSGDVKFHMQVVIPPGKEAFEKKITLQSTFVIENAKFTKPETQLTLAKIAERPEQKEPDVDDPARFAGQVLLKNGVSRFSALKVQDQGAAAEFHGTYNLITERVEMHGHLKTETSLTKTTSGIKSVFAKIIEPFYKKQPHETVVPVKIGGTYRHPQFALDILN